MKFHGPIRNYPNFHILHNKNKYYSICEKNSDNYKFVIILL